MEDALVKAIDNCSLEDNSEHDYEDYPLNTRYKRIFDTIHGDISVSNLACMIIDTPYFQRLRHLHQLGTCYLVFPSGNYSRFEHSIGTYHIAGMILECILKNSSPAETDIWLSDIDELTEYYEKKYNGKVCVLDNYICELIKIAALCHDVGHGPFSHAFDDVFLPTVKEVLGPMDFHENRSGAIIEYIINTHPKLKKIISQNEINFIKNLINPSAKHIGFVYQIVSNNVNGLDVDKYDYISRDVKLLGKEMHFDFTRLVNEVYVLENMICYPKQYFYEIIAMYTMRYRLHKQIYSHKATIATQFMINELMTYLDPILNISNSVDNIEQFCDLTDDFILSSVDILKRFPHALSESDIVSLNKADEILQKIRSRNLYAQIDSVVLPEPINISKQDFAALSNKLDINKIIIYTTKMGFVSGNKKNPLDNIYFYSTKQLSNMEQIEKQYIKKEEVSKLISNTYQEYVIMIYYKDKNAFESIELIKNEFKKIIYAHRQYLK